MLSSSLATSSMRTCSVEGNGGGEGGEGGGEGGGGGGSEGGGGGGATSQYIQPWRCTPIPSAMSMAELSASTSEPTVHPFSVSAESLHHGLEVPATVPVLVPTKMLVALVVVGAVLLQGWVDGHPV